METGFKFKKAELGVFASGADAAVSMLEKNSRVFGIILNGKQIMKKKILKSLKQIEKLASKNWMQGNLTIEFSGCPVDEWDQAIESINQFPRHRHIFEVAPGLNVSVLLN